MALQAYVEKDGRRVRNPARNYTECLKCGAKCLKYGSHGYKPTGYCRVCYFTTLRNGDYANTINTVHANSTSELIQIVNNIKTRANKSLRLCCKHGHLYTDDNTINTSTGRACRICRDSKHQQWFERKLREGHDPKLLKCKYLWQDQSI